MNNSLLNNYAIVCGSTQGIGLCVAQNLAKKGFNLILVSRNEKKLQQNPNKLRLYCHYDM